MSFHDIMSSDGEVSSEFDMDNIDMSLDYNTPELMTSDFFESVLSLSEASLQHGIDSSVLSLEDDVNMLSESSSHTEEVYSPGSITSESSIHDSTDESISAVHQSVDDIDDSLLMSLLDTPETVEIINNAKRISMPVLKPNKPTKIVLQNPNNKKIVTKPLTHSTQLKPASANIKTKKILKVHNITANGRSVLLPLNVKSIKILKANDLKSEIRVTSSTSDKSFTQCKMEPYSPEPIEDELDVVSSTGSQYPALNLTNEEKRLLSKEGIQLPTHYPLTKNEERELKRIRRKIRNKISAQDSRKRKKEYVDGLEERAKRSSEEKKYLLQRIKQLQRQNNKLMSHFSKLQALLFKSSTSKATPSTCVMVVLLSALLVSLPNIRLPQKEMNEVEQGARRTLLSSQVDDELHMDEFLVFKDDTELPPELTESENITEKELTKMLEGVEKGWGEKDSVFSKVIENVSRWLGKPDKKAPMFAEPDIDEGPPLKRTRFDLNIDNSFSAVSVDDPPMDPTIGMLTTFTIKDTKNK
ncbi:hypothetical protein WA026_010482 [Henosepilachna vigintioctopunctata]|uniref:BZIP domain-containing protein n=1 Tax=Henosepilachna vigintioctopunctata TaxID=420089 RepID=A0AAW1V561_9CUCU